MKKNLMTLIGAVLIIASVFGMIAAGFGMNDVSDILRYNKLKKAEVKDAISFLEKKISELEQAQLEAASGEDDTSDPQEEVIYTPPVRQNPIEVDWDAIDDYDSAMAAYAEMQQQVEYAQGQMLGATMRLNEAEEQLAACSSYLGEVKPAYDTVYPLYQYYLELQETYDKAVEDGGGFKAAGLAAAVMAAKTAYEAKLGGKSISTIIADYQNAQAAYDSALAERNAASANLKDLQAMYDEAVSAMAEAKKRIDNAEYNKNKAAQYNAWEAENESSKNQPDIPSHTVGSDELAQMLSELEELSDTETIVRTGIDALLGIEGIAAHVTSITDYDSVINAARIYVDENSLNMERELDMRQRMCSFLRLLGIGCLLAGIACIIADHRKSVTALKAIFIVCGIALIASAGVTTYGLIEGFDECVYTLADGTADGSLQMTATFILLGVSLVSAVASGICFMTCPTEAAELAASGAEPEEEDEDEEVEDHEEEVPLTKAEITAQIIAALSADLGGEEDEEYEESEPEPVTEEPEKDHIDELEKTRLKYEEALREYEAAIKKRYSSDE